jgi:hypothetical protein
MYGKHVPPRLSILSTASYRGTSQTSSRAQRLEQALRKLPLDSSLDLEADRGGPTELPTASVQKTLAQESGQKRLLVSVNFFVFCAIA